MLVNQLPKKISPEQSVTLDFFRGFSAQLVLLGHMLSMFHIQSKYNLPVIQNFGVLVFFLLSGFLISNTTFIKGEKYGLMSYTVDRFSRIFYSFIPALLLVVAIDLIIIFQGNYNDEFVFSIPSFFTNLLMLQSYPGLEIGSFGSARPFWTVAVEWWFYITFGFSYYVLYLKNKTKPIFIILFLISIPVTLFYINGRGLGLTIVWYFGFLLAITFNYLTLKINYFYFVLIIALCLVGIAYRAIYYRSMYDLGIGLFFTIIIFIIFNSPAKVTSYILNPVFSKFSKFLASFSYSLYLIHYSILELFLTFLKEKSIVYFILIFLLTNFLSFIFYYYFEKNHIKLKLFLRTKIS